MTTWVLEQEVFADADAALASAIREHGDDVIAWNDDWWFDGRWPRLTDPVIFHGSLANADRVARDVPWSPGAFCSTARFRCSAWWPEVAHRLVAESFAVSTVADLVREGPSSGFGDKVFVRPDSPLKPFSGRVLERGAITLAALDHGYYYDDVDLPVIVTPVEQVSDEWRFVVASGAVVAGSGYTAQGRSPGRSSRRHMRLGGMQLTLLVN